MRLNKNSKEADLVRMFANLASDSARERKEIEDLREVRVSYYHKGRQQAFIQCAKSVAIKFSID